jgi:hypothetical protein
VTGADATAGAGHEGVASLQCGRRHPSVPFLS